MTRLINWLAVLIASIGAINWGLVAFFKFNLVEYVDKLAGGLGMGMVAQVIYAVVAIAGLFALLSLFRG